MSVVAIRLPARRNEMKKTTVIFVKQLYTTMTTLHRKRVINSSTSSPGTPYQSARCVARAGFRPKRIWQHRFMCSELNFTTTPYTAPRRPPRSIILQHNISKSAILKSDWKSESRRETRCVSRGDVTCWANLSGCWIIRSMKDSMWRKAWQAADCWRRCLRWPIH